MEVSPLIIVGPTKLPYGYSSGALKSRPSRMISPPSSKADEMSEVTRALAPGEMSGPLIDVEKISTLRVDLEMAVYRSVPGSNPPLTLSACARSTRPGNQAELSPTITAESMII